MRELDSKNGRLKFIETRWKLNPLGTRDAAANNLLNAFDFNQEDR